MVFDRGKYQKDSISDIIDRIKNGDKLLKEKFINDYKPFIIKSVSEASGKYIDTENSEEFSVGLLAFNEAIDSYNETKNRNFLSFSDQVISRRIIDYKRSNQKNNKVYPFTYFQNEENEDFEERYLKTDGVNQFEHIEIKEEMLLFEQRLGEFGISLEDLVINTPKHKDSKVLAIKIARVIADNNDLFDKLVRKKNIPMVDLMKLINVNQRTVERHRKFIIAICLILKSGLGVLKWYVKNAGEGGKAFG